MTHLAILTLPQATTSPIPGTTLSLLRYVRRTGKVTPPPNLSQLDLWLKMAAVMVIAGGGGVDIILARVRLTQPGPYWWLASARAHYW